MYRRVIFLEGIKSHHFLGTWLTITRSSTMRELSRTSSTVACSSTSTATTIKTTTHQSTSKKRWESSMEASAISSSIIPVDFRQQIPTICNHPTAMQVTQTISRSHWSNSLTLNSKTKSNETIHNLQCCQHIARAVIRRSLGKSTKNSTATATHQIRAPTCSVRSRSWFRITLSAVVWSRQAKSMRTATKLVTLRTQSMQMVVQHCLVTRW